MACHNRDESAWIIQVEDIVYYLKYLLSHLGVQLKGRCFENRGTVDLAYIKNRLDLQVTTDERLFHGRH